MAHALAFWEYPENELLRAELDRRRDERRRLAQERLDELRFETYHKILLLGVPLTHGDPIYGLVD